MTNRFNALPVTGIYVARLLPIARALLSTKVLMIAVLGRALRASLAVLALHAPRFGTATAAFVSIVAALVATVDWYLGRGNPRGGDNACVALLTPLLIMVLRQLFKRRGPMPAADTVARPAS